MHGQLRASRRCLYACTAPLRDFKPGCLAVAKIQLFEQKDGRYVPISKAGLGPHCIYMDRIQLRSHELCMWKDLAPWEAHLITKPILHTSAAMPDRSFSDSMYLLARGRIRALKIYIDRYI